jgi:hypothetical protein
MEGATLGPVPGSVRCFQLLLQIKEKTTSSVMYSRG